MAKSTIIPAADKQDHAKIKEPASFSYESVVKEELIIEDVLEPVEDDGLDEIAVSQSQSKNHSKIDHIAKDNNSSENNQKSSKENPSGIKKWHCEKCNKSFPTSRAYSAHMSRHRVLEEGRFTCQQCERRFLDNTALRRHNCSGKPPECPKSTDGKGFVCPECGKTFSNPYTFYQHKYRHKVVKAGKYKCELCDKVFMDKSALTKHKQNMHQRKKKTKRKPLIMESDESEAEQAPEAVETDENGFFKCPDCDKRFEFRNKYSTHIRQHIALNQELYKCKTCELIFKSSSELRRHERAHERQKSRKSSDPFALICPEATLKEKDGIFKCSACEKTFEQRRAALCHLMRHSSNIRERIQCNLCPKTYVNRKYLAKHQVEHKTAKDVSSSESSSSEESASDDSAVDGDSEFKCTDCNKTFWEKRLLNRHIRRHEAIKESKFPCKLCDVRCGDKRELIRHEEMHARKQTKIVSNESVPPIILERNNHTVYKCPECALIFTKQRVYFTHTQRHVNVRNGTFKCETCGTCCPTRKNLMAHMEKHRAGKVFTQADNLPFECPECGKKFPKRRYLIQHVQRHEAMENGSFQCKVCAKYFGSYVILARHAVIHGGKDTLEELKCSECDLICATRLSLTWHLQRHEAKRNGTFECDICRKKMGSKQELKVHASKHAEKCNNVIL